MPGNYAHYRFGAQILPTLPANVRRPIQRFRRLYDVGLHGPDLFFYYNIFMDTAVGRLGTKFHRMTGREFFGMACRRLRLEPTEAGQAYLYGVLAHYCLDAACHPFILEAIADGKIGHTELETEFDRYLLTLDGKSEPHTFDTSPHMKLTKGECVTVSEFYPGANPGHILQSLKTMASVAKLLATPAGTRRNVMEKGAPIVAKKFTPYIMGKLPNENCTHLNEDLKARYDQAAENYAVLLEQLTAHMSYNAAFGEEFDPTFG